MKKVILLLSVIMLSQMMLAQDKPGDKPVAPYSPAIMTSGGLLFISGQIPLDPESGKLLKGDISGETRIVMERISGSSKKTGWTIQTSLNARSS